MTRNDKAFRRIIDNITQSEIDDHSAEQIADQLEAASTNGGASVVVENGILAATVIERDHVWSVVRRGDAYREHSDSIAHRVFCP